MNIGENIKKYRKSKDITQEVLAERIGVTYQAISKWERGDSFPDITLLPALANFFDISVDELLGCTEDVREKDIDRIITNLTTYDCHYQGDEMRKLVEESLKKYPGDFKLMAWYVYAWQNKKPKKCIEVGEYLLEHCTIEEWRTFSRRNLVYAYKNAGYHEKAKRMAEELPGYYDTRDDVLVNILEGEDKLKHVQHKCFNLAYEFWYDIRQIRHFYSAAEQIELFKKSNAIYDAIYENDMLPIKLVRKMRNFQGMAEAALSDDNVKAGLEYMEQAVNCAEIHDKLPKVVEVNSLLFNQHPYDRQWESSEYLVVSKELAYDFENEDEFYASIRETERYKILLARLMA